MSLSVLTKVPVVGPALDFLFPPLCLGCGDVCTDDDSICERCRKRIETFEFVLCAGCGAMLEEDRPCPECGPGFLPVFAFGNYRSPLKEIIIQFKFKGISSPARFVATGLTDQFRDEISKVHADALVPVPLHPHRQYRRGYNQARIFADALSKELGLPVDDSLVVRTKWRRPQSRIGTRRRERNVRDVFMPTETVEQGRRVILVDDVVTTGATVREAARMLNEAGCRVVLVLSMAHGL